jgi:hypothetical protein
MGQKVGGVIFTEASPTGSAPERGVQLLLEQVRRGAPVPPPPRLHALRIGQGAPREAELQR